jgi:hypothetical protein
LIALLKWNILYIVGSSSGSPGSSGAGLMRPPSFGDIASNSKTPILKTFQQHHATVEKADSVTNPIYERYIIIDGLRNKEETK